jgi:hypothetical protein
MRRLFLHIHQNHRRGLLAFEAADAVEGEGMI